MPLPPTVGRDRRPGAVLPGVVVLLLVLLCGCATAAVPVGPPAAQSGPSGPAAAGQTVPTSVRIPSIGVDERETVRLGVAGDGTAEVPQDHARAGWFDRGGNPGPTVLMGHVDSLDGPAVFYDLRELAPGDGIEVGFDDGTLRRYVVERSTRMPKDAFPTFEVFGGGSSDLLRLVTCAGEFDRGARSYVDNLVVHARAV